MMNVFTGLMFFLLGILSWPMLREISWVEKIKNYVKSFGLFKGEKVSNEEVRTQLFFHDLMNQIHGLGLFFSHKVHSRAITSPKEAELVLKELDVLQTLAAHHFQMKHRNFKGQREVVCFEELKEGLYSILESYFPDHRWQVNFQGRLTMGLEAAPQCLVHRPVFFRILTNVIKNIQEKNSPKIQLNFDYRPEGLMIVIKNSVPADTTDVTSGSQKFPWQNQGEGGMGLVSITFLAESLGGYSRFFVDNSWWTTEVFLPRPSVKKTAAAVPLKLAS